MTITDQIKILDKKILQNAAQYDVAKKAAIISAWSPKNLDKVEYLTGEDLSLKPKTIQQARFEYSPLGVVQSNKVKKITNINKKKKDKNLVYNSQNSFIKFKDIDEFKELPLDSMFKKLNGFKNKLISLKLLIHKQMKMKN